MFILNFLGIKVPHPLSIPGDWIADIAFGSIGSILICKNSSVFGLKIEIHFSLPGISRIPTLECSSADRPVLCRSLYNKDNRERVQLVSASFYCCPKGSSGSGGSGFSLFCDRDLAFQILAAEVYLTSE